MYMLVLYRVPKIDWILKYQELAEKWVEQGSSSFFAKF